MLWKVSVTGKCLCGCEISFTRNFIVEAKTTSSAKDKVSEILRDKRMSSRSEIVAEPASCTGVLEV